MKKVLALGYDVEEWSAQTYCWRKEWEKHNMQTN
jgi:hypothetical protein